MEVNKTIKIEDITHDDLVNLFSTALYGSTYLDADYPEGDYYNPYDDCYEDRIAKALLNGFSIDVIDTYAEGCVHGNLPHKIDEETEDVSYKITLADIKKGLEKAGSGKFKLNFDGEEVFARKAFEAFVDEDATDFDLICADCLMQIIVFNEIIYG